MSVRTERAVHWALQLHPEDRPDDIDTFLKALFIEDAPITQPFRSTRFPPRLVQTPERALIYVASGLMVVSLLLTILRNF